MAKKYDKEKVVQRICDALKAGNLRDASARYAGITRETFYQWLKDPDISDKIEQAEAQAHVYHITNVRRAAEKDWKASAWWAQHYPGTKRFWKPVQAHEHSGPEGGPIEFSSGAAAFDHRLAQALEREGTDEDPGGPVG